MAGNDVSTEGIVQKLAEAQAEKDKQAEKGTDVKDEKKEEVKKTDDKVEVKEEAKTEATDEKEDKADKAEEKATKIKDAETKIAELKKDKKDTAEAEKELETLKAPEKIDLTDIHKDEWYSEDTYKKPETKKPDTKDINTKANNWDKYSKHPIVEAIISAIDEGKNPAELFEQTTDIKNSAPEQIFKLMLNEYGLKGNDFDEAMKEFEDKTTLEKAEATNDFKKNLIKEQNEKQSDSLKKYSETSQANRKANTERDDAMNLKLDAELSEWSDTIKDKNHFGIKMTPEIVAGVNDYIKKEHSIFNPDGSFNTSFLVDTALKTKYFNLIMKTNVENAVSKAVGRHLDEGSRPSGEHTDRSQKPVKQKTQKEENVKDFSERFKTKKP